MKVTIVYDNETWQPGLEAGGWQAQKKEGHVAEKALGAVLLPR